MMARTGPNALEYIRKSHQIAGNILLGIGNRAPHAPLRSQMNHGLKLAVVKEASHTLSICQIERDEPESRAYAKFSKPRVLKPGVIVVVQVVYPNHFKAIRKKLMDEMGANETGRAGD
jgi:hypothetical protein